MSQGGNTILEAEVQVSNIMKDLRQRINNLFDKYMEDRDIPKLPDFNILLKNNQLRYDTSKRLTETIDELMVLKLRVNVVRRNLDELQNIQAATRSDYSFMCNFKNNLKKYDDELSGYKFELADLIRNANNKLRVLESVSFYEG